MREGGPSAALLAFDRSVARSDRIGTSSGQRRTATASRWSRCSIVVVILGVLAGIVVFAVGELTNSASKKCVPDSRQRSFVNAYAGVPSRTTSGTPRLAGTDARGAVTAANRRRTRRRRHGRAVAVRGTATPDGQAVASTCDRSAWTTDDRAVQATRTVTCSTSATGRCARRHRHRRLDLLGVHGARRPRPRR